MMTALVLGIVLGAALVVIPLAGAAPVLRPAPFLFAAAVVIAALHKPWAWSQAQWRQFAEWRPSPWTLLTGSLLLGALLFWFVLTRFQSTDINAIDFTVYYDRPTFQTLHGRPMFVESADDPTRAYRNYLAVHAHWIMFPLAAFYAISASPIWLLALSVFAIVAGAIYVFRIVEHTGGGGALATAAALAFAFNDNTARTLNYGFHVEVLYAWFLPWMIHAGLRRRWITFLAAAMAATSVKEDAFLLVFACGVTVWLVDSDGRRQSWPWIAGATGLAIANLLVYYTALVPRLSATGAPFYVNYWSNYGPTTMTAAIGMATRPWHVLSSAMTSALTTRVMVPHLYLPLAGWKWSLGILPVALLYGASANEQLRAFEIYYSIVFVPFFVLGSVAGALKVARRLTRNDDRARAYAAAALVAGALLAGISNAGYSLRPWRGEISQLHDVIASTPRETPVLVQSALYPHAGYAANVQLLSDVTLADPRFADAIIVLAPDLDGYPLSAELLARLSQRPEAVILRAE